jgi:hypothetical protein
VVAWFLIAIGTIAFFAYIAVTGVTTVDTTGTFAGRAETIRRIDAVTSALSSRVTSIKNDGIVYAPAGVAGTNEYLLPADLQSVGTTSFGTRFQYCPMGLPLNGQNGTISYPGGSYGVSTESLNDRTYVISGRVPTTAAADPNVIGFVIAQLNPTQTMPGCGQVVRSGENYTAPNGIVRTLRRSQVAETDANRVSDGGTWFVSPAGGGGGGSMSSPATLDQAVAAYRGSLGGTFTIRLAAGSYALGGNGLDQTLVAMSAKKEASSLLLIGTGAVSINTAAISVPSNLELKNVAAENSAVVVRGGRYLKMTDSTTGTIVATDASRVMMNGTNQVRGTAPVAVQLMSGSTGVINGAAYVYYPSNAQAFQITSGARLTIAATTLYMQPSDGGNASVNFAIDQNSSVIVKSSVMNFAGYADYAFGDGGNLTVFDTTFNFNRGGHVAVQTTPGAQVVMYNTAITGSQPVNYGIASQSSSKVQGSGTIRAAARCWYQGGTSLHRLSWPGITGANSSVSADENWATITDPATSTQVSDYQAMVQRNVERSDLRSRADSNQGGFNCQSAGSYGWTACAVEGGYCNILADIRSTAPVLVRYGSDTRWTYRVLARGTPCDNNAFLDPAIGTVKTCQWTN